MSTVKDRVCNLERTLEEYIKNVGNSQMQTERELRVLKQEMREFKDEMREDRQKIYKKWGEIANKMGTVVEDIVAPNIPSIVKQYFHGKEMEFYALRVTKRDLKDKANSREFDIIAVFDDKLLINETKTTPRIDYIDAFKETLAEIYDYFQEYSGKKIIPIFSSRYIPDKFAMLLTIIKVYAMAMKDDSLELLNY
ncbi:MAG: hypothetical protein AABZ13_03905 [Planctomycetota bacterium]